MNQTLDQIAEKLDRLRPFEFYVYCKLLYKRDELRKIEENNFNFSKISHVLFNLHPQTLEKTLYFLKSKEIIDFFLHPKNNKPWKIFFTEDVDKPSLSYDENDKEEYFLSVRWIYSDNVPIYFYLILSTTEDAFSSQFCVSDALAGNSKKNLNHLDELGLTDQISLTIKNISELTPNFVSITMSHKVFNFSPDRIYHSLSKTNKRRKLFKQYKHLQEQENNILNPALG